MVVWSLSDKFAVLLMLLFYLVVQVVDESDEGGTDVPGGNGGEGGGATTSSRAPSQRATGSGASLGARVAAVTTGTDPENQWQWFRSVLDKARKKGKTVYIVGHTPPGIDDREAGTGVLTEEHNRRYLQIVRQYADMIRGQFFGHWHSDTFRIVYSDDGEPVSWIMVSPSITPYRQGGPNNPGLRLYKFDNNTGQILDYAQYYLNLAEANSNKQANWRLEYNLREYYNLGEITALSLHDLADRFTQPRENAFVRYYGANRVSLAREVEEIWGCGGALNGLCALRHYCAVTRLEARSYATCVASYAEALASSKASATLGSRPVLLAVFLLSLVAMMPR
ncbi:acid sphingomyelinase-like phosphodiesterase 3b [Copidosoma floridanum]|uniref:acid sphingomyelinase-like phosphodiesterase 3b n=1 Tax=Copidosoma floridanum TaxID=29053 RepID=UPI000C6FA0D2|nr:acid sphingomyelinase-like phosphodiesterase 3b [Copidosoma floridanum]